MNAAAIYAAAESIGRHIAKLEGATTRILIRHEAVRRLDAALTAEAEKKQPKP